MEQPNTLVKIALNEVVQKVNSGTAPTDALKKVASEFDLNPNYIHRVGEALNVALHYKHFKTAEDRSSEFLLADIPEVVASSLNLNEKTAAAQASESFNLETANDEVFNYNRMLSNPKYKKAYLEITAAEKNDNYDSYGLSLRGAFQKSAALLRDLEQTLENKKTEKVGAELNLNSCFSKLASHFKRDENYRLTFSEFESQAFSKHAEKSEPFLDLLYKAAGLTEERGVHDKHYQMFDPSKELGMFDTLLKASEELLVSEEMLKTSEDNYTFEKDYYSEITKAAARGTLLTSNENDASEIVFKKKINSKIAEIEEDPVLKHIEKKAGLFQTLGIGAMVNRHVGGQMEELLGTTFSNKKSFGFSGKPNNTLDNLERQLLVQDLIITDPILSKVNPARVARAFEQILRLSPQVSKEKEVVRAMLRQAIASQAVAPHEADQWTKLDTDILKRKIVSENYLRGKFDTVKF